MCGVHALTPAHALLYGRGSVHAEKKEQNKGKREEQEKVRQTYRALLRDGEVIIADVLEQVVAVVAHEPPAERNQELACVVVFA